MRALLDLFITFAKIGAITFGGGYAMLPILQREVVEKKQWVTNEDVMDYYAIGQTTPGIIAINTATFIGQKTKGTLGGVMATLGVVFPSLIIISVIAYFLNTISESELLRSAFSGIRVSVYILILQAVLKLWKTAVMDKVGLMIFTVVFSLAVLTSYSPVYFVIFAGVLGVMSFRLLNKAVK
ncbi:chromate transporter [Halolactibacillus alkaliphilus]|uniref:Chromate transporter n=1 Tax=Halolactibacillus alkaliphilus TaxID=442899 RepID=A0A511WZT8_9BACI|nr:chromate transporter [Halolactibacillus alkaliphilus]GEN56213.1 chromate transporter [Halolactibacillus alkaliphilus]GGN66546.1 chromate transporter [Halolactibacillus alkaliphilus]SFO67835.1 chromate transporter [Halolactibacillus alkaliphilus]